jgi:AcrR family transcriptional regulator
MDNLQAVRSQRKPRGQGAARRGEILDAAKQLFLTDGFEHTTIRKIAVTVGVSAATLYLYFPDKDAIMKAIAESTFEALLAALEHSHAQPGTTHDRFRAGLRAYIDFGLAHPDEYRLTFLAKMMTTSGPGRPAVCEDVPAAERSFAILAQDIGTLMEAGTFHHADILLTAEAIWASIHGITALLLDQAEHIESNPHALINRVLDILVQGLLRST